MASVCHLCKWIISILHVHLVIEEFCRFFFCFMDKLESAITSPFGNIRLSVMYEIFVSIIRHLNKISVLQLFILQFQKYK